MLALKQGIATISKKEVEFNRMAKHDKKNGILKICLIQFMTLCNLNSFLYEEQ